MQIFDHGSLTREEHLLHYRQQMLHLLNCFFLASPYACLNCGGCVFVDFLVFFEVKRKQGAPSLPRLSDVAFCFNPECGLITAKRKDTLLFGRPKWVFGSNEVRVLEPFCNKGKLQKISREEHRTCENRCSCSFLKS